MCLPKNIGEVLPFGSKVYIVILFGTVFVISIFIFVITVYKIKDKCNIPLHCVIFQESPHIPTIHNSFDVMINNHLEQRAFVQSEITTCNQLHEFRKLAKFLWGV